MIALPSVGERISDVAIFARDLTRSIAFYRDTLGFRLEHRMPGFADFSGPHVRLALWEHSHFAANVGFAPDAEPAPHSRSLMIAVHLPDTESVAECYRQLVSRGVDVAKPPASYPAWNARALYFCGPDGEVWELYAWLDGGEPGRI